MAALLQLHELFWWLTNPYITYLGRAFLQCSNCYPTKQTNVKRCARYFLVKVFHQSGSCHMQIPKSRKKPNGYTRLHYIKEVLVEAYAVVLEVMLVVVVLKTKQSLYRPELALRLRLPELQDNRHMKVVRFFSPIQQPPFTPGKYF